jgi:ADP-ribosylglycohydrolase
MTHAAALMGALVADAAALGLHWIYDPARIETIARTHGGPAFVPPDAANYDGVKGYFAHGARQNGMLTQYGEVLHLAIRSLNHTGRVFDQAAYQSAYAARFGPGGGYVGYIDRVMRGTLANLAAGQTDPSGIDDDQLPALAALPALIVAGHDTDALIRAIRVTNVNDIATDHALTFARLLALVLQGTPLHDALRETATTKTLHDALENTQPATDYAEKTGRACHLPMGLPLSFHIMQNADSYLQAITANILAGGDSAGRAIIIGAVMGAVNGITGIPTDYLLETRNAAALWQDCRTLANPD